MILQIILPKIPVSGNVLSINIMGLIMVCIIASNFHLFKIRILNDVDTMTNALKPNSFHYWQTPIQMSNLMNI